MEKIPEIDNPYMFAEVRPDPPTVVHERERLRRAGIAINDQVRRHKRGAAPWTHPNHEHECSLCLSSLLRRAAN